MNTLSEVSKVCYVSEGTFGYMKYRSDGELVYASGLSDATIFEDPNNLPVGFKYREVLVTRRIELIK